MKYPYLHQTMLALTMLCLVLGVSACDFLGSTTNTTPTPRVHTATAVVFTPGQDVESNSATISKTGSSITLTDGPNAVKGTKVDFPAGALPASTKVSIGYNTGSMKPNDGTYPGVALTLHVGTTADTVVPFDQPITITVPYTDTASIPTPYYIDSTNHLEPVQLTSVNVNAKTFSFQTSHASLYTWITPPRQGTTQTLSTQTPAAVTTGTYDTGFDPKQDGFQVLNFGSSLIPAGECFGMASFALWYFQNEKDSKGSLYPKFMDTDFGTDNLNSNVSFTIRGQNIIATRAHTSIGQYWDEYYGPLIDQEHSLPDETRYNEIVNTLENSGPAILDLQGTRDGMFEEHEVLAYKIEFPSTTSTPAISSISIYNPNDPGKEQIITYNTETKQFEPFKDASSFGITWTKIAEASNGSLAVSEPYQNIENDAEANFNNTNNQAQITIKSPTFTPEPFASLIVSNSSVTLQGMIKSGSVLVTKFHILIGDKSYEAELHPDGSFTVILDLQLDANQLTFQPEGYKSYGGFTTFIPAPSNLDKAQYVITLQTAVSTPTTAGTITEYPLNPKNNPSDIFRGSDGNLWFVESPQDKIGRITPSGSITEYPVSTPNSGLSGITSGPDGNVWFTETGANKIGRITPSGSITEYPVSTPNSGLSGITSGSDGNLWFTEHDGSKIGRIEPKTGKITEYPIPTTQSGPLGMVSGPDDNVWFVERDANKIGSITPNGSITEYPVSTPSSGLYVITVGPDGNLWFTETGANKIGFIEPKTGKVTEYPVSTPGSGLYGIAKGLDGNIWFTEEIANKIGRITPSGLITEYPVSTPGSKPDTITSGPNGILWFTEMSAGKVAQVSSGQ